MQNHAVPDCYAISYYRGKTSAGDVNYRAVLDVRTASDPDVVYVAADHAIEPHTGIFTDANVADQLGACFDERARRHLWDHSLVWPDHSSVLRIPPAEPLATLLARLSKSL